MSTERYTHKLTGCAPIPLAQYLKALGILRLVGEQADPEAQGWWSGDVFYLRTRLDLNGLQLFFVQECQPTPVVAPWNGGSGFYLKDNQTAITKIANSSIARLGEYARTINSCRSVLARLELKERPDGDGKERLLKECRNQLPDCALTWLDAAYVLTNDGPKYPPLLGTGGNDGRLDFTNNLMQRILDLINPETGEPTSQAASWWRDAFFSHVQDDLQKDSILGQFDPGAVDRPVNPWDYLLMIEGALMFAAAATKRHEAAAQGILSYPFCVRSAGIGYGSAASDDESSCRAEMWLPLWSQPSTHREVSRVFSEGRAELHGRSAKTGVDFARSIATLGTDRGIREFARLGFHARNGLAYFAVPLGRFRVSPQPQVNLLGEIDEWLVAFRRAASSENAPSSATRSLRRLEAAILELCRERGVRSFQSVVSALGNAESALANSKKWRERDEMYLRPVPFLTDNWLTNSDDGSPELRLAASLAGMYSKSIGGFRQHLEPVDTSGRWPGWNEDSTALCDVVWSAGSLENNLIAILTRRAIQAVRLGERTSEDTLIFPGRSRFHASLGDVGLFLREQTDDAKISDLARGLSLLDWRNIDRSIELQRGDNEPLPDATFTLLKLCHTAYSVREIEIRLEPIIARLAVAGRLADATNAAAKRLLGSGLPPAFNTSARAGGTARRIGAALLFPIGKSDIQSLADTVLKPRLEVQSVC